MRSLLAIGLLLYPLRVVAQPASAPVRDWTINGFDSADATIDGFAGNDLSEGTLAAFADVTDGVIDGFAPLGADALVDGLLAFQPLPPDDAPVDLAPEPPPPKDAPPSADDLTDIETALSADATTAAEAKPAAPAPASSLLPDISFIVDVAAAWFSDHDDLQTGGHDPSENGFNLQQVEMAIGKAVDPYFRFDGNIVFGQFGVEVEEAYATTLALPYNLQVRAGQFLTRFGRLNSMHPHTWDFVDQPFAIGRIFGSEGNRGLGAEVSYLTPLPWFVELVGSVTEADGEGTARSFFAGSGLPVESPLDVQATLAVKQFFELSPDWSLLWGLSSATGPNGTGHDNRSDLWGSDLYVKYRPITTGSYTTVALQAEIFYRRRQIPDDVLSDVSAYAYLTWRFAQRWGTAARYEYGSAATTRAGRTGADDLDPEWTRGRHRVSANLTFWPSEFSRVRAQASIDAPRWLDAPIVAGFLAMELSVGAHGAHKF